MNDTYIVISEDVQKIGQLKKEYAETLKDALLKIHSIKSGMQIMFDYNDKFYIIGMNNEGNKSVLIINEFYEKVINDKFSKKLNNILYFQSVIDEERKMSLKLFKFEEYDEYGRFHNLEGPSVFNYNPFKNSELTFVNYYIDGRWLGADEYKRAIDKKHVKAEKIRDSKKINDLKDTREILNNMLENNKNKINFDKWYIKKELIRLTLFFIMKILKQLVIKFLK